jgi:hypothetical protein
MYKRLENVILSSFAVLAIALGFWGFALTGSAYSPSLLPTHLSPVRPFTWIEAVHCLFSSIGLLRCYDLYQPFSIDPWQLVIAQFAVPGVALLTAARLFLAGLRKDIRTALARHKIHHTIVCGIGDVGMQVVQNLRAAHHHVVAIDLENESPNAATCEKSSVPVLQGDAKNPQVLLAAGLEHADTVIVCTGSDTENMDVALRVKSIFAERFHRRQRKVQVLTELRDEWLFQKLINTDKKSLGSAKVDLRLFNPFSNAARMLIQRLHLPPTQEFAANTFVILGFGAYGQQVTLHLIRAVLVGLHSQLNILVIDQNAEDLKEKFLVSNPAAAKIASLYFLNASVASGSPDISKIIAPKLRATGSLLGVSVALGDDKVTLCAALELRTLLDSHSQLHVPIYARLEHLRQLGELVSEVETIASFHDRLQVYGTLEEILSPGILFDSRLDTLAQTLHEDYRHRSQQQINPQANVSWHELPEFMKMSNRWRADHTPLLFSLAGFQLEENVSSPIALTLTPEEIEILSELEHRRFTVERRLIDWQSGETRRNLDHKNPHLESWSKLSESQREWNRREVANLPLVLASLGIELHRIQTIRAYDDQLPTASIELTKLLASPVTAHCLLIVDLDSPEACRLAEQALDLPSLRVWLFSREEPKELYQRKSQTTSTKLHQLIDRAEGWLPRDQVLLEKS